MNIYKIPSDYLLQYRYTGKFKAPASSWKHEKFRLEDYELIVVTEGTLYLSYNGEKFTVEQGEYLLLPPSNSFRQGFKESYCSFYWMHFETNREIILADKGEEKRPAYGSDYGLVEPDRVILKDKEKKYYLLPQTGRIPKIEKMVVLMKQLQDCVKSNYPVVSLNAMVTSIVAELYGQLSNTVQQSNTPVSQKQFYLDIIDYVKLNNSRNIKVKEIASYFGYNEKYLSHIFSINSGMSLKQFILQQKIDTANYYLTDTNISISEIANALGFSDSNNFSRVYKKCTGLTPSQYRDTFAKRLLFDR